MAAMVVAELAVAVFGVATVTASTSAASPSAPHPLVLAEASSQPLLVASDFGPGWVSVANGPATESGTCFSPRSDLDAASPVSTQSASWASTLGLPAANESVYDFGSEGRAAATFGSVGSSLAGCSSFAAGTGTARTIATVRAASLPVIGQRSSAAAFVVTVKLGQAVGQADYVLATTGTKMVLLVYADGGPVDQSAVAQVAQAAVARLDR